MSVEREITEAIEKQFPEALTKVKMFNTKVLLAAGLAIAEVKNFQPKKPCDMERSKEKLIREVQQRICSEPGRIHKVCQALGLKAPEAVQPMDTAPPPETRVEYPVSDEISEFVKRFEHSEGYYSQESGAVFYTNATSRREARTHMRSMIRINDEALEIFRDQGGLKIEQWDAGRQPLPVQSDEATGSESRTTAEWWEKASETLYLSTKDARKAIEGNHLRPGETVTLVGMVRPDPCANRMEALADYFFDNSKDVLTKEHSFVSIVFEVGGYMAKRTLHMFREPNGLVGSNIFQGNCPLVSAKQGSKDKETNTVTLRFESEMALKALFSVSARTEASDVDPADTVTYTTDSTFSQEYQTKQVEYLKGLLSHRGRQLPAYEETLRMKRTENNENHMGSSLTAADEENMY
ncbi:hypothetical protein [Sansalvadorimonas verongulae]|uniref:hypothetical protein n=1 Tax=Sansalvadorimonas verongulae TaxID=2172824 RepID=UPI0012BB4F95|nr:hypothetical protein [Sansalvadorimonas verongulae]MTI15009.1 hypothetical protein [Sansalvadorimonas verongulae]